MALFYYEIRPGDSDHLSAYEFIQGVVEAEAAEIEGIVSQLEPEHFDLLRVLPVEEAKVSLDRLRRDIGQGLSTYHSEEVAGTEPCPEDQPFITAYEVETYGAPLSSSDEAGDSDDEDPWGVDAEPIPDTSTDLGLVLGCRVQDYEMVLPPDATDGVRAALAAELQQDRLAEGLSPDTAVEEGSFAELLLHFGWNTDQEQAASGWFRLWTDAEGIGEPALRALEVMAPFVAAGSWLDVVDGHGRRLPPPFEDDESGGRCRLWFDGQGVSIVPGGPLSPMPPGDRTSALDADQGGSVGRLMCIVAQDGDTAPEWAGEYHALGSLLNADGVGTDQLNVGPALAADAVAIHLPDSAAGAITAAWLEELLSTHGVRVLAVHPALSGHDTGVQPTRNEPRCRKCGAPPTDAIVFGVSGIGERVISYDSETGYYSTEDVDPAEYAQVAYAECQACGERAGDIHQLLGMVEDEG